MALGPRDTQSLVMLTGWDATELQNYQLQDGTSMDRVVAMLNAGLGALAAELYNHPLYSALASYQDSPEVEYRVGTSNGMNQHTEYARPDQQRAATEGHMLPLIAWDRALGWTWDYLRKARMSQIEADIADGLKDVRDRYRIQILTRLLKRGDDSGAASGLGSSGYSPGFATAAASTSVDYTPPTWGGTSFDTSHEHYVGIAGGLFTAAVFTDAKDELREHGHEPPYDFVIGPSDESTVRGLTGFVKASDSWVQYGALQDIATFGAGAVAPGLYPIGALNDFRIWVMSGMPQYYGFGWKSYGANSQRNPLRIRLQKGVMRPAVSAYPDNSLPGPAQPVKGIYMFTEFGVGVYDRTAGTARYVNNTTWADGTPT